MEKDFYENLYNQNYRTDIFDSFFHSNLPQIDAEKRNIVESHLTLEELTLAVKEIKSGKSPGSDGLSTDFLLARYK